MSFYRTMVRIPNDTTADEDEVVLTFHFATDDTGTVTQEVTDIHGAVGGFMTGIDQILSANLENPATIQTYNLEDPEPRVPILPTPLTLTLGTAEGANQLAVVLRLQAQPTSGVARARRRGRLYIGPLSLNSFTAGVGDVVLVPSQVTACETAVASLLPTVPPISSGSIIQWSVFSRAEYNDTSGSEAAKLAAGFATIISASVPNRYGVQRRRAAAVTSVTDITP